MKAAYFLLPLMLLGGCAGLSDDGYPSLAPRDIEKIDINAPAADKSEPSPPADAALLGRLRAIEAKAQSGNAKFEPLYAAAQRSTSAARGSSPGSESWVVANMAISRAEAATTDTASAVADIDKLVADLSDLASKNPATPGLNEALTTQRRVKAIYDNQLGRTRALSRQLNGG